MQITNDNTCTWINDLAPKTNKYYTNEFELDYF